VIHKVHGDCHFSAQRLSPGQHPEQKETMNRLWCRNENDKKNPAPRSRNFPIIEPKILYFVTPVALLSSLTEDGSTDLAPISSFWALGWTLLLGSFTGTKTAHNVARHRECVVNLPSPEMWHNVEKLAPLTGKNPVPKLKSKRFRFEPHKFVAAELTPVASEALKLARARECPVHMEARYRAASTPGRKAK